ncbi:MAG: tetratricopeptide repeat protein, partial [Acidobacteriota bacterium]|nr:tetratricopeptide repeat protein [Acidobacteriota bacterium]
MNRSSGLSRLTKAGGVGLVLTAAVLAAVPSASLWYVANVVIHPLLGLCLGWTALRWVWRAGWPPGPLPGIAAGVAGGSLLSGVGILGLAVGGRSDALLAAHVWVSLVAAALVGLWGWRALGDWSGPGGHTSAQLSRAGLLLLAAVAVAVPSARASWDTRWRQAHAFENPTRPPATMADEGAGAGTALFPSSAQTSTGELIPSDFFLTSETCARCHRDIYDQWNGSAHHFSSFNNQWYRRSIEYMQEVVGTEPSKWCAGCHDHAVFFNGRFDQPIKEQIDTPEAQAGLGCTSCHSVTHVGSTMGQGDFVIEYPPLHDLAASDNPVMRGAHDLITNLAPEPHRRTFMKPFHQEQGAEFCSTCHKVHLDVPVNGYRWIRGFNEYDNWQGSGVSGQGARSFYYPETPQTCGSCHMPLVASDDPAADDGFVRSHRFPGANTALPHVNRDPVQLAAVQDFLRAGQVSVDVFGIARVDERPSPAPRVTRAAEPRSFTTFAVGEESGRFGLGPISTGPAAEVVPLGSTSVAVRRGESVRVEVVVRTRNVGHFFPGGTVDGFDVWVEFEAVDETGRVLLHSGAAADGGSGPVDPGAHFYRSLQLDEHGNPINKRNAWMTRSVAYVRLIPPGAADTVHYRLRVPDDAGDRITLRAKLNYRKFAWWYTQWAFAGERDASQSAPAVSAAYDDGEWTFTGDTSDVSGDIKAIPDIPTTVMAESEATLDVIDADARLPELAAELNPSARGRWNDYGIGLLLQGDLRGAEAAFRMVMAIDPNYPDGPVNVARAKIREGDVDAAIPLLEQALALSPDLARAHFFLGTSLRTLGRYDEAMTHLEIARRQYPRDRVVLNEIGGIQFRPRVFAAAVDTSRAVLRIDPEDMQAHYNLILSQQGAGRSEEAARERARYDRLNPGLNGPPQTPP